MAQYNAWQNNGLSVIVAAMDDAELRADRGAFFGSIFETLNHLLWGDLLWMSRFDGGLSLDPSIKDSTSVTQSPAEWAKQRAQLDVRISGWADAVTQADLTGDIAWHSVAVHREISKPKTVCIAHFFNHQTHHRGQVHAMLTAAGQKPSDTDLPFMPET
jgi:uncharacterized damage-inducible protein DinB